MLKKIKTWLRLNECKSLKIEQINELLDRYGDPVAYMGMNHPVWHEASFITPETRSILSKDLNPYNWDKIQKFLEQKPLDFIAFNDERYPQKLKNTFSPPLFLFAIGDTNLINNDKNIGIVGTRKPSPYGRMMTNRVSESLVKNGYTIVSGLAAGIDSEAHKTALEHNGKTIAVVAHGLDIIYPPQNRELAKSISENGLIISEYPPTIRMEKYYFIQRNRIISGLSKGVAVMEGKKSSGAMITAKFALEQNKDIFALPGEINRENSEGPNSLIQQGAEIITSADSIICYYESDYESESRQARPDLTSDEEAVWSLIKNSATPVHSDEIILISGMAVSQLSGILFMLELKSVIKRMEGNKYISLY